MRAAALYALNDTPAGALQVAAQYHLPSSLSDMLCGKVTEQLAIAPLDLLAAALTSALSAQGDGNILMEAIHALRHPPPDAPDATSIIRKMDGVQLILAPIGNTPLAAHITIG